MTREDKSQRVSQFIANPRKAVWTLAVPVMLGMAVQTVYSIADMIFVGFIGGEAIAALTFNMPLIFLAIGLVFGLGAGTTAVIARYLGAKNLSSANNAAEHSVLLGLALGLLLTVSGLLFRKQIFTILGTPAEIFDYAINYFTIIALGFSVNILSVFFRSILSGEGDTRTPILFMTIGTILNIILDPILILALDWGIAGAAWATVISQLVVFLLFVYFFFIRKGAYIQFRFLQFSYSAKILRQIFQVGIPASASMVIMSTGSMVFNWLLSTFGSEAVAGYGIAGRIDQIYFMPNFALATSLVTLTGMFYGAQRLDLVRSTWYYALRQALMIALGSAVFFYITAPNILFLFSREPRIVQFGVQYLRIIVFAFPFISVGIISGRVFQGFGEGMPGLFITTTRILLISAPLSLIFVRVYNAPIEYIWYSIFLGAIVAAVLAVTWLNSRIHYYEKRFRQS
jgi:putative MATE family efflux protein